MLLALSHSITVDLNVSHFAEHQRILQVVVSMDLSKGCNANKCTCVYTSRSHTFLYHRTNYVLQSAGSWTAQVGGSEKSTLI